MAEANLKNIFKKSGSIIESTGLKTSIHFKLNDTLAIARDIASQRATILARRLSFTKI